MTQAGSIVEVLVQERGSQVVGDHLAGAVALTVEDPTPWDDAGGQVYVDGNAYTYTTVTEVPDPSDPTNTNATLGLTSGLLADVTDLTPASVWNGSQVLDDVQVLVAVGDEADPPIPVTLTVDQRAFWEARVGPVDPPVAATLSDDLGRLLDAPGYTATINGAAIEPGTLPPPTTSDGEAPATSPTPEVLGGVGVIHVRWTNLVNDSPVTYEVHVSTVDGFTPDGTTLVEETPASSATIKTLPDGTALTYGPEDTPQVYYVRLIARDVDGAAPASPQGSASLYRVGTQEVSALYAYFGTVSVDQLTAGILDADVTLSGSFKTSDTGQRAVMDPDGIHLFSSTGAPIVDLPTDPSKSASFAGSAQVTDLAVTSGLSVQTKGTIESGAGLELVGAVSPPAAGPGVVLDHPLSGVNITLAVPVWTLAQVPSPTILMYGPAFNSTSQYTLVSRGSSYGTRTNLNRNPLAGGAATTSRQVASTETAPNELVVGVACDGDTAVWILVINTGNSVYTLRKLDPVTLLPMGVERTVTGTTFNIYQGKGVTIVGGVAYCGFLNYNTPYRARVVAVNLTSGAVTTYDGPTAGVGSRAGGGYDAGVFDYGDGVLRFIFNGAGTARVFKITGAALTENTTESWPFGSDGGVGTNDPFRWCPTDNAGAGGFRQLYGTWNEGGPSTVANLGIPWKTFTGIKWTTESASWAVSSTLRDSNASGPAGTSETGEGKRTTFTMTKRARLRLSTSGALFGAGTDDPNAVSFYLGRNPSTARTDMHLQGGVLANGVTTLDLSAVNFATANPPSPTDPTLAFPGSVPGYISSGAKRADGTPKAYIDGLGAANLDGLLPPGAITMWAGGPVPDGWYLCRGQALSRTLYPDLFAAIGTAFGAGDGSTTFNVPDLQTRFPIGVGSHALGANEGETTTAARAGRLSHTHNHAMGNHSHALSITNNATQSGVGSRTNSPNTGSMNGSVNTGSDGSDGHPFLALNFLIKT